MARKEPPFLALELDAKKAAQKVARACGVSPGDVLWGLAEAWEYVWTTKRDVLPPIVVIGCFGAVITPEALVAFGFLEAVDGGYRVKGAARLLRIHQAQSDAGKANSGNLKKGTLKPGGAGEPETPVPGSAGGGVGEQPAGSTPALTPTTHHPPPTILKEATAAAPVPFVVTAPTSPSESWGGEDFWRWAQVKRQDAGLIAERGPPPRISFWWSPVLLELNGDVERLKEAFYRFGEDPYWQKQKPPLPWRAFQTNWPNFVPREVKHAHA